MPDHLYYALYHSRSLVTDSPAVHNEILKVSQRNNARADISGFLHREGDHFIQFLEGPKTRLLDTLARIGRDTRHCAFEIIQSGPAKARMLPDWKMGFTDPAQLHLSELLDVSSSQLEITAIDPFDLVIFLVNNARSLRENVEAA